MNKKIIPIAIAFLLGVFTILSICLFNFRDRLFKILNQKGGRDFNYINGVWK